MAQPTGCFLSTRAPMLPVHERLGPDPSENWSTVRLLGCHQPIPAPTLLSRGLATLDRSKPRSMVLPRFCRASSPCPTRHSREPLDPGLSTQRLPDRPFADRL